MSGSVSDEARQRLSWPVAPEVHERIRRLWLQYSIAEEKRDLDGLLATLTPDCVYQVVPSGQRWEGHAGARSFYTSLFGAFPDAAFALQEIVIGPQGVFEAARLTGTHRGVWAGIAPTDRAFALTVLIYFPWDRDRQLFAGEKIFYDRGELGELLLG